MPAVVAAVVHGNVHTLVQVQFLHSGTEKVTLEMKIFFTVSVKNILYNSQKYFVSAKSCFKHSLLDPPSFLDSHLLYNGLLGRPLIDIYCMHVAAFTYSDSG